MVFMVPRVSLLPSAPILRLNSSHFSVYRRQYLSYFRVLEHVIRCQHVRQNPGACEATEPMRLAVKQYLPKSYHSPSSEDVTIIAAHANAVPKEVYEPLWDDVFLKMKSFGRHIRGIWIADIASQGQSGVMNESVLGNESSWYDHARDLLFLINQRQDEMPHPLIGIGHSLGGMQMAHLSLLHPNLFRGIVLMEPVIQQEIAGKAYALASTYRRDIWPSRKDATLSFQSNKYYQRWDERALEMWIEHGLREVPTDIYPQTTGGEVTLTTTRHQEVSMLQRPGYQNESLSCEAKFVVEGENPKDIDDSVFYRPEPVWTLRNLPEIKPSVLYVFGEESAHSTVTLRREKLEMTGVGAGGSGGLAQGRVTETVLPCGHLAPMERVTECASAISKFIDIELTRWEDETKIFCERGRKEPRLQRVTINDRWRNEIGPKISNSMRNKSS
ncbi:toxin biosynthesis protein [Bisporella sp. PMI_857]|nr:toxin biosynthesis protein [Bisporella sp. PMI_857]